jgi:hypothetical protein
LPCGCFLSTARARSMSCSAQARTRTPAIFLTGGGSKRRFLIHLYIVTSETPRIPHTSRVE